MDTRQIANLVNTLLRELGIDHPFADIRQTVADFESTPKFLDKLSACLGRLGLNARPFKGPVGQALHLTDHHTIAIPAEATAEDGKCAILFNGKTFAVDVNQSDVQPIPISIGEFAQIASNNPKAIANWLIIEPRPSLQKARTPEKAAKPITPVRRLLGLFAPDRRDIAIVILFAVGVGVLNLATPIAVQTLVNFVAFGGLVQPLVVIGILLFAFLTFAGAMRVLKAWIVDILQRRIFVRVVGDLAYRLPRVRIDAYDRRSGPELVNRFFDVMTVQKASQTILLDGVGVLLQAMIGLVILAFYHPFLLAFDVILILAIAFILFVLGRGAVKTAIYESKAKYAVAASLEEIALNPLTFKQAGGADLAWFRADHLAAEYVRARKKHFSVVLRQIVGAVTLQAIAATALLTLGGFLVINGELTLGQLVAAELIVSIVLASLAKFGKQLEQIYDLLAGVDKLGQLIDLPLERLDGEDLTRRSEAASVEFVNINYEYENGRTVFTDFNLRVEPGEHLLITGDHGAGKSTFTDLLCGIRSPDSGRIELDGIDLREVSLDTLRKHIAVVKGLEVVEGTIAENVRLERADITNDDVRRALEDVGLMSVVRKLPQGLDTHLNNFGRPLSYGQARRLMIARAIAANPRVMVLDDVLDELDRYSRDLVIKSVMDSKRPWTVIVTTHGARPVKDVSRVVALNPAKEMEAA